MELVCRRHMKQAMVLGLVLLLAATVAVAGLGVMGTILALAYVAAAGMLIGLIAVSMTKEGY